MDSQHPIQGGRVDRAGQKRHHWPPFFGVFGAPGEAVLRLLGQARHSCQQLALGKCQQLARGK
jgi:hypothetical protein